MTFEVIPTPDFEKSFKALAKKHRSLKADFLQFAETLKANPNQGVELTPGIRKIRLAITSKGRGKSGGARVITYNIVVSEEKGEIFLIDIYDKADYSTVDVNIIIKTLKDLGLI